MCRTVAARFVGRSVYFKGLNYFYPGLLRFTGYHGGGGEGLALTVTLILVVRGTLLGFTTPVGRVTVPLTVKVCSVVTAGL